MNHNTNIVDEAIKTEDKDDHHEGVTHSHPCFGMIHVSRWHGQRSSEFRMFGTETEHNSGISITIEEAEVNQDLGRNWYFGTRIITEVEMSPIQYAELITNPNTSGVPCTIKYRQDQGRIQSKHIDTVTQHVEGVIDNKLKEANQNARSLVADISKILSQKGTLKKADKERINSLAGSLASSMTSALPFYEESVKKSIVKAKTEAKMEVESYVSHAITKVGLKALQNPELMNKLLEDKSGDAE